MLSSLCCVALLCLVTISHSAPLGCTELIRPLDRLDFHFLRQTLYLVAGGMSDPSLLDLFKAQNSVTVSFTNSSSDNNFAYIASMHRGGECHYSSYNLTLEGSTITYEGLDKHFLNATFIHTSCLDCMGMLVNVQSGLRQHLYLFSRRRQLEQTEMEEFRAQVRCLNMPPPVEFDPTKEACPDEMTPTAPTQEDSERGDK